MISLGFDTSNYTTSMAWFDGTEGENSGRLLTVKPGELGLRQSDALFQHVARLPEIALPLAGKQIGAVGASTRPRAVEGSYMPCFLAGMSQGKVLSELLGVPFHAFSHQQGHIAAVLYSSGHMELMEQRMLAWHLSGGTTELLLVEPGLSAQKIGGTEDLSAGQLIDRTGQMLGIPFPAGRRLDELAGQGTAKPFPVKVRELSFSLSGMQNKAESLKASGAPDQDVAAFAISCVIGAVKQATKQAEQIYGDLPVVFTGGVSSNSMLRRAMEPLGGIFGTPQTSTDNALGIAVLTYMAERSNG